MNVMKKQGTQKWFTYGAGFLTAAVLAVVLDCAAVLLKQSFSISAFGAVFLILALGFCLAGRFCGRWLTVAMEVFLGLSVLTAAAAFLMWGHFGKSTVYRSVDTGKAQLYGDRSVMVIVPHQDDELNVLGGVMEEYVRYGSQVYPVFVTNGDCYGLTETRFREALAVCDRIGIPEKNAVFLGYGDQWAESGPHIYNAEPGAILESANGKTETYGTSLKGVFREGRAYTLENILDDLQTVILEYRPQVIVCTDYDSHIDHRALTLMFDKTMGNILKEHSDYRPVVLKGFAYMSAWYAPFDYYDVNIRSTRNVYEDPCYQSPEVYRWEDRLRLPVDASTLARSLLHSGAYETLNLHASQDAGMHAAGVVNGDKVLWYRDTNSLCYSAEITVSSGDGSLLNDFMLLENHDLLDGERKPFDGVWIPATQDDEKWVNISFENPVDVETIVLYDHPSETENVLDARIVFADGSEIMTGPLDTEGAATEIAVYRENVTAFRIELKELEGEKSGLTEVEAFGARKDSGLRFLKLTDPDGNFVYDYWTDPDGAAEFGFYTFETVPEIGEENYTVSWDNPACGVNLQEDGLSVSCPEGECTTITVRSADGTLADSVYVQNPGTLERLRCALFQKVEEVVFVGYCEGRHKQLATVKILDTLRSLLMD